MSEGNPVGDVAGCADGSDGRRRQLRDLLLSAADAARQGRRVHQMASRVGNRMGRAVRERISMLVSAAE
jgi:hypothetical protein